MTERHLTEKSIFLEAVAIASPEERASYLQAACGDDRRLREGIEALLRAHERPRRLLDSPGLLAAAIEIETETKAEDEQAERVGSSIGPYRLIEAIGEGGMGVVYMAEQTEPVRRRVALKIIKPGMDTKQVVARFEAERQALAMMDHPNIAKVHDVGTTGSGRPYFVMELVRGLPITEYCDREQLSIPERLELVVLVCRAVQHAHQKGIIHRDLKPSNVLVTVIDGAAVPKIIDFGVAKATDGRLTDRTLVTGFQQLVGTPLYMSPEQADLSGVDVDTRSDVYSLGVLLYELLTGSTPFDSETLKRAAFDEMRRIIREEEPQRPSTRLSSLGETLTTVSARRRADLRRIVTSMRGELDWVVMKAIEKDRQRRYQTANDLAADVLRYLGDLPVEACPPSAWYRLRKWLHRNRAAVTMIGLLSLALLIGGALAAWQAIEAGYARERARIHEQEASHRRREAGLLRYVSDIRLAAELLRNGAARAGEDVLRRLATEAEADQGVPLGFEWGYLQGLVHQERASFPGHSGKEIYHVEFSPDGRFLASSGGDHTAQLWDTRTWLPHGGPLRHDYDVNWVSFSPDGRSLATACDDYSVGLWDVREGRLKLPLLRGHTHSVVAAVFTPDGKWLISGGREGRLHLWEILTGRDRAVWDARGGVEGLAIGSLGDRPILVSASGSARLFGLEDVTSPRPIGVDDQRDRAGSRSVALSRDGRTYGTTHGHFVGIYDTATRRLLAILQGHSDVIQAVAFSPDGRTLASAGDDTTIRLWDVPSGTLRRMLTGHTDRIWSLAFSPDGETLASAGREGAIKLWDKSGRADKVVIDGFSGGVAHVAVASDETTLIILAGDGEVRTHDLRTGATASTRPAVTRSGLEGVPNLLSRDGRVDVSWRDRTIRIVDLKADRVLSTITLDRRDWQDSALIVSPDGTRIAFPEGAAAAVRSTKSASDRTLLSPEHMQGLVPLSFLPGNKLLGWHRPGAFGDYFLSIWDLESRRVLVSRNFGVEFAALATDVSDDGRTLAVGSRDHTIWLLDAETLADRRILRGHSQGAHFLAFSADGRTLVSTSGDRTTRLWNVATGLELFGLDEPEDLSGVRFANGDRTLVTTTQDSKKVILWHSPLGRPKVGASARIVPPEALPR